MKSKLFFSLSVVLGILIPEPVAKLVDAAPSPRQKWRESSFFDATRASRPRANGGFATSSPVCGQGRQPFVIRPGNELKKDLLLEPLLSFDEAARLYVKNDPRGYYQLALGGQDLTNEMAYKFMKKSDDMGYVNARMLLALDMARHFCDRRWLALKRNSPEALCCKEFDDLFADCVGKRMDTFPSRNLSLSSSNDVAEIRRKFEACRIAGVNQATNAIALLDHWVRVHEDSLAQKRADDAKKQAEELQKSVQRDVMKDIYGTLTNANRIADRNIDEKVARLRLKVEREAKLKADAEAKARKRAAALEELSGWPLAGHGTWPAFGVELNVYGTNVTDLIVRVCGDCNVVTGTDQKTSIELMSLCERECHFVYIRPAVYIWNGVRAAHEAKCWEAGKGVCLIEKDSFNMYARWKKYDDSGRLIKWGSPKAFFEYAWMTNKHAVISSRLKDEWAKKHGLTLEDAEKRATELIEELTATEKQRAQREQRAQLERERAKEEREQQRAHLLEIQEQLKAAREAREAQGRHIREDLR